MGLSPTGSCQPSLDAHISLLIARSMSALGDNAAIEKKTGQPPVSGQAQSACEIEVSCFVSAQTDIHGSFHISPLGVA